MISRSFVKCIYVVTTVVACRLMSMDEVQFFDLQEKVYQDGVLQSCNCEPAIDMIHQQSSLIIQHVQLTVVEQK